MLDRLIGLVSMNGLHFYLNDWNGSRRVQTDYEGVVEQTCMNLPYGNGETCSPYLPQKSGRNSDFGAKPFEH